VLAEVTLKQNETISANLETNGTAIDATELNFEQIECGFSLSSRPLTIVSLLDMTSTTVR
jgi:hypothetical protein